MNIFQKISLLNKLNKVIEIVNKRAELSDQIKKIIENIKDDIDALAKLAPEVKELIADIKKALKW